MEEGPRKGEFLFTAQTVRAAPRFFRGIEELPLTPSMPFATWTDMSRQITGPLIPAWLVQAMPEPLLRTWLDTPAWKVLLMILVDGIAILLAILLYRSLRRIEPTDRLNRLRGIAGFWFGNPVSHCRKRSAAEGWGRPLRPPLCMNRQWCVGRTDGAPNCRLRTRCWVDGTTLPGS